MLQGIPPYQLAYNMKFPGTYAAYAVIMALFGQTPAGIHFGVLCLTTLTALMLFWLGKKILDPTAGIVSASFLRRDGRQPFDARTGGARHAFLRVLCHRRLVRDVAGAAERETGWSSWPPASFSASAVLMKQQAALIALWASLAFIVWLLSPNRNSARQTVLAGRGVFGVGIILPFACAA